MFAYIYNFSTLGTNLKIGDSDAYQRVQTKRFARERAADFPVWDAAPPAAPSSQSNIAILLPQGLFTCALIQVTWKSIITGVGKATCETAQLRQGESVELIRLLRSIRSCLKQRKSRNTD